jgi:1-acyl-sn-glycerol-3-phosphate acyltransferase
MRTMDATPPPPRRFLPPFYAFAVVVVRLGLALGCGLRVTGREHVPRVGGCVVAVNHISAWDPPVLGIATPREIHVMAKKELFASWPMRRVLRGLRVFPVDRGANDIGAVKEALRRLERGHAVGIFFEGTRNAADDAPPHLGAAYLAHRAGVPLVPTAIWREGRAFRVAFGSPLPVVGRSREAMTATTDRLVGAVRALIPSRT